MSDPINIAKALWLLVVCAVLTADKQWPVDAATADGKQFFMEQDTGNLECFFVCVVFIK